MLEEGGSVGGVGVGVVGVSKEKAGCYPCFIPLDFTVIILIVIPTGEETQEDNEHKKR